MFKLKICVFDNCITCTWAREANRHDRGSYIKKTINVLLILPMHDNLVRNDKYL